MPKIKVLGKTYQYKPYHDEISKEKLMIRLQTNPSFIRVLQKNLTDGFINSMKSVINPNVRNSENTIWNVSGESGSGKSLMVMSLIKLIGTKNFSYKNFVFYDQQILDIAKELKPNSFIVRDEAVDTYGIGSNRVASDVKVLSETARKYGLNLAFLSPSEREISVSKIDLQTVDIDYENRITRVGVRDPLTRTFFGALYIPVLPDNDTDWVTYNDYKDNFISEVLQGKRSAGKLDYKQIAKDLIKEIDIEIFKTKTQRLAYIRDKNKNLTNSEVNEIGTWLELIIQQGALVTEDD